MQHSSLTKDEALDELVEKGLIGEAQSNQWRTLQQSGRVSLFWEIRIIVGLGAAMVVSAIGKILYDNFFDALHDVIIGIMALFMMAAFLYCYKHVNKFTRLHIEKGKPPFFDIILLSATTLFISLEGYIQFRYEVFGEDYADMAVPPTIVFLATAYFFDDRNVLFKGLIGLAAWFSINYQEFNPKDLEATFAVMPVFNSIILGSLLTATAFVSQRTNFKAHFKERYLIFSSHLILLALCSAIFQNIDPDLNALLLLAFWLIFHRIGKYENLSSIVLFSFLYFYVGISHYAIEFLNMEDKAIWLYFIVTGFATIYYFYKQLKK